MVRGTLVFDIETYDADRLYTMSRTEFVRLIGYRWVGSDPVLTTDADEVCEQIDRARWIIGHNIHFFDLPAVFGVDSNVPVELADGGRVFDTFTHATLANPAPRSYVNRHGKPANADKPERALVWYGLDEQAYQLGVPGKTHDLKDLALRYGPEDGSKAERIRAGFGRIPVDDPEYRAYLLGDVAASEAVARALAPGGPASLDEYALREQRVYARAAVISANGFRVLGDRARTRVDDLAARRAVIMDRLVEDYHFPTEGKSPWASAPGKEAIVRALADAGVTEVTRPDWPRTPKGALQLGGEILVDLTKGTPAEDLGVALAELKGQRSLAQLALDSQHDDGFAHPRITMLQKSGRWSTTDPGLTVWTAHGEGAIEKAYFGADTDDEVLLEFDLSNADARAVAAMSGDERYAERFRPGPDGKVPDGHLLNAWAAWGRETVGEDKHNPVTAQYRQMAKPLGHGWSYGGGYKTLSAQAGVPLDDAKRFCEGMAKAFHRLVAWQERVRGEARRTGHVRSHWGRRMPVDPDRIYTQAPALLGQNFTREVICDFILRAPLPLLRRLKVQVHDAVAFSVPRAHWEQWRDSILRLMHSSYRPTAGGLEMTFPAEAGPPGGDWYECSHE